MSTARRRRLAIFCDGTWNSADQEKAATNVVRLARIVRPTTEDGRAQIIHYDSGVGTGNALDRIAGGGTGIGLSRNVREAYSFIANNYNDGDEIFLFGFSRGAYTARCIAGLIGRIGILRKRQMGGFAEAWDWNRRAPDARAATRDAFEDRFRGRKTDVTVRCIGVWDTVGSLGIPTGRIPLLPQPCVSNYAFFDPELGAHVDFAFQALAIDERRQPFLPSIWRKNSNRTDQDVRQVWFAGVHSDIGGGYSDHGAADVSLLWMVQQVHPLLDLDIERLTHEMQEPSRNQNHPTLHDSFGWTYRLAGDGRRNWQSELIKTPETQYVHESVHERIKDDRTYQINSRFGLGELSTWRRGEVEERLRNTWQPRTLGAHPLPLLRRGTCDKVLGWLGGG